MRNTAPSCPISTQIVNENVIRWIAFLVVVTSLTALLTGSLIHVFLLLVDFGLRAFTLEAFSPFRWLSIQLVRHLGFGFKATNHAPKRFASRVGFAAVIAWTLSGILDASLAFWIIGSVLVVFATLESAFAVCVGCILYQKLHAIGLIHVSS